MGGWADQMVQSTFTTQQEALQEVIRILENLGVHHKAGAERFWTPRESYQLWRAIYDGITTQILSTPNSRP